MLPQYRNPVYDGYFADPFILRAADGYYAYGTGSVLDNGLVFEILRSRDLTSWESIGAALEPVSPELGTTYWAPEVACIDGVYWLYYSVGVEDAGHQIRVASASSPGGPFLDAGVNLTPGEIFAIDPHPFRDDDGSWYLYFARDVLDGERVGTQLAADVLESPTSLRGDTTSVLCATADWQLYQRDRLMYGKTCDWYTLEGPAVVRRDGRYYCIYSGGSWQGPGYGVSWASADHPLGPWQQPDPEARLLETVPGRVIGPGHSNVASTPDGDDVIVYHAWEPTLSKRQMFIDELRWTSAGPQIDGAAHRAPARQG